MISKAVPSAVQRASLAESQVRCSAWSPTVGAAPISSPMTVASRPRIPRQHLLRAVQAERQPREPMTAPFECAVQCSTSVEAALPFDVEDGRWIQRCRMAERYAAFSSTSSLKRAAWIMSRKCAAESVARGHVRRPEKAGHGSATRYDNCRAASDRLAFWKRRSQTVPAHSLLARLSRWASGHSGRPRRCGAPPKAESLRHFGTSPRCRGTGPHLAPQARRARGFNWNPTNRLRFPASELPNLVLVLLPAPA